MKKETKQEIAQMISLMERMDMHYTRNEIDTLLESLEEGGVNKNDRKVFTDLNEFFNAIKIQKSMMTGLSYIQGYEIAKIYPQKDNFVGNLQNQANGIDKASRAYSKINAMLQDTEMTNPTGRAFGGYKSMKNPPFAGVIKVTNYVFNWGSKESLADFNKAEREKIKGTRLKYGFGKADSEYPADDWRRHADFKGIGEEPTKNIKTNPDGSQFVYPYSNIENAEFSLYKDNDSYGSDRMTTRSDGTQYQKRAFRFGLRNTKKQWANFYLVDNNGEIDLVEKSLSNMFYKASLPKDVASSINTQMTQDEIDCRKEISQLASNRAAAEKTWLVDNVAYIVSVGYDRLTGERVPFCWINRNINIDKFSVKENELQAITDKEIDRVIPEVKAEAESAESETLAAMEE